jgi:hypothetical protein
MLGLWLSVSMSRIQSDGKSTNAPELILSNPEAIDGSRYRDNLTRIYYSEISHIDQESLSLHGEVRLEACDFSFVAIAFYG